MEVIRRESHPFSKVNDFNEMIIEHTHSRSVLVAEYIKMNKK